MSRRSIALLSIFCAWFLIRAGAVSSSAAEHQVTYQVITSTNDLVFERENGFDRISLKGAIDSQTSGFPLLPVKMIHLLLPEGTEVAEVTAVSGQQMFLGEFNILPGQLDEKTDGAGTGKWTDPDPSVYGLNSPYPGKRVEIWDEGYLAGNHLVTLAVYPLEYYPQSKQLFFYSHLDITVELKSSIRLAKSSQVERRSESSQKMYEEVVCRIADNKQDLPRLMLKTTSRAGLISEETDSAQYPSYLVVTTSDFKSAFSSLVEWKTKRGIKAAIVCMDSILTNYPGRDDAEKLRNFLIEAYHKGASWVLLGGNQHVVPIRYAYPTNTSVIPSNADQQICDLYFSDVDGDWDKDNDGVWGEPQQDAPDLYPDLFVGRVPCAEPSEAEAFVEKLLSYEKNPGNGSTGYLTSALWLCSDQMRDWSSGAGQHTLVSPFVPSNFSQDITNLIESPTGDAESPLGPEGGACIESMNQGWGIIGVLAHGKANAFVAKSSFTNGSPKSWVSTSTGAGDGNGHLPNLGNEQKYGIMYSIACSQSAIDVDEYPYMGGEPCVGAYYPLVSQKGGVAFLGYSRWGWVSVSYLLFEKFLEYLTSGNPEHHIGVAEALSRCEYPSYRDLNYGHNLFGDPEMQVWADLPLPLEVVHTKEVTMGWQTIGFNVTSEGMRLEDATIRLILHDRIMFEGKTDMEGYVSAEVNLDDVGEMSVIVTKTGYLPYEGVISVVLAEGVDDGENSSGITTFDLAQNYPNPFNPVTSIQYTVCSPHNAIHTSLKIFNILGRKVRTLVDELQKAGNYQVVWDGKDDKGKDVSSGIYFCTFIAGDYSASRKMTFLK